MILKDSFYTISNFKFEDGVLNATLNLNALHTIFDGHFPGNPITPGVVQMEIVKELLSYHFNRSIQLVSMSNCKFLTILNPNEAPIVDLTINVTEIDDQLKVSAQISAGEINYFKLAGVYC